jgi:hypothetical protein
MWDQHSKIDPTEVAVCSLTHAENANTQKNTSPVTFKKNRNHDEKLDPERSLGLCDF